MQKQLIASAKEKGFESHIIGKSVEAKYSNKDFYYLWMCELQKWLREEHNIHIEIHLVIKPIGNTIYKSEVYKVFGDMKIGTHFLEYYQTYEQALEEGLKETLKLM